MPVKKRKKKSFETEAALCFDFISCLKGKPWTPYAETAGFDILLVHDVSGTQIGIEAKLDLNAKVLTQILPSSHDYVITGPDYRAVLVPWEAKIELEKVCFACGVKVMRHYKGHNPELPDESSWSNKYWMPWLPEQRCTLPEYVPDVPAGVKAPVTLSQWKIQAIKIQILLEQRNITRSDLKHFNVNPTRWMDRWYGFLEPDEINQNWKRSNRMPDFCGQHPEVCAKIRTDIAKWLPSAKAKKK